MGVNLGPFRRILAVSGGIQGKIIVSPSSTADQVSKPKVGDECFNNQASVELGEFHESFAFEVPIAEAYASALGMDAQAVASIADLQASWLGQTSGATWDASASIYTLTICSGTDDGAGNFMTRVKEPGDGSPGRPGEGFPPSDIQFYHIDPDGTSDHWLIRLRTNNIDIGAWVNPEFVTIG